MKTCFSTRWLACHAKRVALLLTLIGLGVAPARLTAATVTWTGQFATGSNWNNAANWSPSVPVAGDFLVLSNAVRQTNWNDFTAGTSFGALSFSNFNFVLWGNWFSLTNGVTNYVSGGNNLVSNAMAFVAPSAAGLPQATQTVWNAVASGSGALVFKGNLTNSAPTGAAAGTNVLVFGGTGDFGVSNIITGVAGLIKSGTGNLTLGAANTYSGNTAAGAVVDTFLLGGRTIATVANVIPSGSSKGNLNMTNAVFDLNGTTVQNLNGLNGDGTAVVNNSSLNTASLLVLCAQNSNSFWGGNITDPNWSTGGLINVSNSNGGVTMFTNANLYHGYTRVQGGTLILTNQGSITNSSFIIVANGRTLQIENNTTGGFNSNRIGDNATVILDNGTINFNGAGSANAVFQEYIGTLVISNRNSTINLNDTTANQTNLLLVGNVVRLGGGTLTVGGTGVGQPNQTYQDRLVFTNQSSLTNFGNTIGIIPWIINGDDYMRYSSLSNTPMRLYGDQDYWVSQPETQWNNLTNAVLLRYGQTLTADRTVGLLQLAYSPAQASGMAPPLNLGNQTLRLASGYLNMSGRTYGGLWLITNGTLTAGLSSGAPGELIIRTGNGNFTQMNQLGASAPLNLLGNEIASTIGDNSGGAVQLNKVAGNPLILSGNNTYTGGTTVSGGDTLMIGNGGTIGNVGYGDITNYGTVQFNRSDDYSFTNTMRGYGLYHKYNTNNITFTSDSPFTGQALGYGGTITLGGTSGRFSGVSQYTMYGGSALALFNTSAASHADRVPTGTTVMLNGGTLAFTNDASAANYSEYISTFYVANQGSCKVLLTPTQPGYSSILTGAGLSRGNNGTVNITGPGLGLDRTNMLFLATAPTMQNGTWSPAYVISGTEFAKWTTNTSLQVTSVTAMVSSDYSINPLDSTANWMPTTNVKLTDGSWPITGLRSNNTLNLAQTAASVNLNLGSLLVVSNGGILASGDFDSTIAGGNLASGTTELIFHVLIPTNNLHALTVSSVITNQAGNGALMNLTKSGPGKLVLSGNNLYTGSNFINEGVLSVGAIADAGYNSNLGTNGGATGVYLRGGTLQFTGDNSASPTARRFDVNNNIGGGIDVASVGNLVITNTFTGANSFSDLVKTGSGILTLGGTANNADLKINVKEGKLVLNKQAGGTGKAVYGITGVSPGATIEYGNTAYGDQIYDNGSYSVLNMNGVFDFKGASDGFNLMTGTGLVTNSAANTTSYMTNGANGSGGITTVNVGDGVGFGGGTNVLVVKGNSLGLTGNNTYHGQTIISSGLLLINGDNRLGTPPTLYTSNQLLFAGGNLGATGGGLVGINTNQGITLTANAALEAAPNTTLSVTSAITGNFSLTKNGEGLLLLNNPNNNWTNGLYINNGMVRLGASEVIPDGIGTNGVTVQPYTTTAGYSSYIPAGILDLNGYNETVSWLNVNYTTVAQGLVTNSAANITNILSVGSGQVLNNASAGTINGTIGDNPAANGRLILQKVGPGILTMGTTSTNAYSGGTIIANGILGINNDVNLGATPATPTTNITLVGGTLKNTGSAVPSVNANRILNLTASGGYLAAGGSPGTLTINGKITGPGFLGIGFETGTNIITNPLNDYAGNTIVGANNPVAYSYGPVAKLRLGASEVIPNGPGKGILIITNGSFVDMSGYTETVNGLGNSGPSVAGNIDNSGGYANLIVGDADTNSSFNGLLKNTVGTLSLTKIGAGTLTLSGANTYAGGTTNAGGMLVINADAALGAAAPLVFSGNSTLQVSANGVALAVGRSLVVNNGVSATLDNQAYTMTINGPISGAGTLTKVGAGTLLLNGGDTCVSTVVNDGSLTFLATAAAGGGFTVNDNKTLTLVFTATGQTVPMSSLMLGSSPSGTATVLNFNGWTADTVNFSPSIWATNLTVNGTVIINVSGQLVAGVRIPLIKYLNATGDLANNLQLGALPRGVVAQLKTEIPGQVDLEVTSASGISWYGQNGTTWDIATTANWWFESGDAWYTNSPADAVTFGDGAWQYTVNLTNVVAPIQVQFTNTITPYTLVGTGKVSGAALVIQSSPLTNTISTTNDYSGGTLINAGMLKLGTANALGTPSGPFLATVQSGTALDLNGIDIQAATGSTKPILLNGQRDANTGSLINSGGNLNNQGVKAVTLGSDASVGQNNTSRFDIRGGIDGGGHVLTKVGINRVAVTTAMINLAGIIVTNGALELQASITGTPLATVYTNAILSTYGGVTENTPVTLIGGTLATEISGNPNTFAGPVTLTPGFNTFNSLGATLIISGKVTGPGTLIKTGPGQVTLGADNDWAGGLQLAAGILAVGNGGTVGSLGGATPWSSPVTNNGALAFARSDTNVFSGVIYGTGRLIQRGPGKLFLGADNQYTGPTVVSGGTLVKSSQNDLPVNTALVLGETNLTTAGTLDLGTFSQTVSSLAVSSTNSTATNSIIIGIGQTLAVGGNFTVGVDVGTNDYTNLRISGGGSLIVTNASQYFTVGTNVAAANAHGNSSTLDLSKLASVTLGNSSIPISEFRVAYGNGSGGTSDTLTLSDTNNLITATTFQLGNSLQNNASSGTNILGAGTNVLLADTFNIALCKANGTLKFASQTAGSPGTVIIGGKTGSAANIWLGYKNNTGTAGTPTGTLDLRGHNATVTAGNLYIGIENGAGNIGGTVGNLYFDSGIFTVTNITMAVKSNTCTGSAVATLNVGGGTFTVYSGGSFKLATQGTNSSASGTLNITGGTFNSQADILKVTNAVAGGSVAATAMVANATLILGGKLGTVAVPLDSVQFTNALLSLNVFSAVTNVVTTTLSVGGANTIGISQLPPMSTTTTQLTLIKYTTLAGAYNFSLASGYRVPGYLSNNIANASIDLVLTNATDAQGNYPITWTGVKNGNWDINTSTNWVDLLPVPTMYQQSILGGDNVRFDDSALGVTTVNLTTNLSPTSVTFSNTSVSYTFTGAGKLTGGTGLTKWNTGSVTLNQANDYTGLTVLNGGTLSLGVNNALPTGTTVNFSPTNGGVTLATLDLQGHSQTIAKLSLSTTGLTNTLATNHITAIITGGPASTLTVNGAADINIGPSVLAGVNPVITNTLDMSGLGNFIYTAVNNTFRVGPLSSGNYGQFAVATLAATNTITAITLALGDITTAGCTTNFTNQLHFGQVNTINASNVYLGSRTAHATMDFAAGWVSPSLTLRGAAGGSSPVANMLVGAADNNNTNLSLNHVFDVSAGTLDALIVNLTVGRNQQRWTMENGFFRMGAGTLVASNLIVGQVLGANSTNGAGNGTFFLSGGSVMANILTLADNNSLYGATSTGTLVLTNNGAFQVRSITKGNVVGTSAGTITLNGTNAVLDLLGGTIGTN
ncbi:MAG: autotransporter-associated beta strand repeat-containing protein, partial [Verrucomicrobiota bacterium]